ncbi:MAG: hypothetical protein RBR50_05725, partial [Candidatus Izemoplasmatales bacterium]|nr:hypothetical protein [Candidatus Izemoplasmatales bacterium]
LPSFPSYTLEAPPPAPLYTTPPELQEMYQNLMATLGQRVTEGIQLPEEYLTNMYRRAQEQIGKEAEEATRQYNENLAARGLAQSGIAAQAQQQIAETALGAQATAIRDIETELMGRQMASMEQAASQLLQLGQLYGEEAFKEYGSRLQNWQAQWEYLKQKNEYEFQKAVTIYGAESQRARDIYEAGVQERLAYIQGNIQAGIAAYNAAARLGELQLQGQIQQALNTQLHQYAMEEAAYNATLQAEAARQQGQGQLFGTIITTLLMALLL